MGPAVASAIEQRPVSTLIPYAKNARTHSPAQVTQIVASVTEFGFTNPILIDSEGIIIAGHGRVMAAKEMGLATCHASSSGT
jgi:ParB-like chromosome segregation protein Spo0J